MIDKTKLKALLRSPESKKYGRRFLITVVLFSVLGFFVLPPIVKSVMLDQLGKALHRTVSVKSISINPYTLSLSLEGFAIQERDGQGATSGANDSPFASFDSLYVNLESSSLFRGGPVLNEIRLVNPTFRIVRLADNRYNFSDLVDEFMAKPKNDDPIPAFSLNNIQLTGGTIEVDDRLLDEKHALSEIKLSLPFVSSLAYATESFVEPHLSAQIDGAPFFITGKSKPFADSLESEIDLNLDRLQLAKYFDYSPIKLPVVVNSGALDARLKLVFHQDKDKPSTLVLSGTTAIDNLDVKDLSAAPLLSFKRLDLAVNSADLLKGKFVVDRLAVESPAIDVRVSADGDINWIEFFREKLAAGKQQAQDADKPVVAAAPIQWSLGELKVSGGAVRWLDESHGTPFNASIDAIDVGVRRLANFGDTPAEFDVSWRVMAENWLKIDSFTVKGGTLDLAKQEVRVADVQASGVRSLIRRMADGQLDWVKPPSLRAVQASQTEVSVPWKVTVAKYVGEDIGLRFEDQAVSPAVTHTIDGMGFSIENLSTEPAQTAKLAINFKLNRRGAIAVDGTIQPMPLVADLNLDVKTLELLPLQSYFGEKLNVDVTRGMVTVNGRMELRQDAEAKTLDVSAFTGGFSGQATIGDFYAVDKLNSADFLRWKSLYFGKVDARLNPDSLSVGEIALSDFFARVIVTPEGKLNLMQMVRAPDGAAVELVPPPTAPASGDGKAVAALAPTPASTVEASKPMMPIKIGKVTLQGGQIKFTDNFVKPNYSANLSQIGGKVTGLSTEANSIADVDLRGSYDNVAPLNLTAKINPLSAKPYLDLQAEIKGIELTPFSSYSGKYAGYAIEKGKLSLFVKYKIENDQLAAENRVFIDQLTFGDAVESPDATKLPVKLAVALLKNSNGEIDINLPISGSLSDPEFSVGGLVVKVIVNLFVKAVTAPFALIGSMFGGSGEELSNVEFDYGRAAIAPEAQKRLENLSKALVDRPALKLEIEGRVDMERDREGLKSAHIEQRVKALKREDLTKNGVESGSAETLEVSAEEYPDLLERVYKAEKFPKPRNMVGLVKSLPVEEMEKLILANARVEDDDLRALAEARAKAVRDWLVTHEVASERVFLLPGKLGEEVAPAEGAGTEQKAKSSRADFTLK